MTNDFEIIAEFIQYENDKPALNAGLPVLAPMPVVKTTADIERLIALGKPQAVIEQFAELVSIGEQWQFAREYLEYLAQLAKAEAHNENLPVIGEDDNGDDILAEPMALPDAPEKPAVKSVEEVLAPYNRTLFKKLRAEKVANIKVDVDGMVFDGDETAQSRMTRAMLIMDDLETTEWYLADNSKVQVTKAQLKEACRAAALEQSQMWGQNEA